MIDFTIKQPRRSVSPQMAQTLRLRSMIEWDRLIKAPTRKQPGVATLAFLTKKQGVLE